MPNPINSVPLSSSSTSTAASANPSSRSSSASASRVLSHLDGSPLTCDWFHTRLAAALQTAAVGPLAAHSRVLCVKGWRVLGSVLNTGQSQSLHVELSVEVGAGRNDSDPKASSSSSLAPSSASISARVTSQDIAQEHRVVDPEQTSIRAAVVRVPLYVKHIWVCPNVSRQLELQQTSQSQPDRAGDKLFRAAQRHMLSCHNELMFYQHIAPLFDPSAGVALPRAVFATGTSINNNDDNHNPRKARKRHGSSSDNNRERRVPPTTLEQVGRGQFIFVLECVDSDAFFQTSPLSLPQARQSLSMLARFHAWAWEDKSRLELVSKVCHAKAGYWELQRRGREEMESMPQVWNAFRQELLATKPADDSELLAMLELPEVVQLADRLVAIGPWVAQRIHGGTRARTLCHGDFKAMNVFLPKVSETLPTLNGSQAVLNGSPSTTSTPTAETMRKTSTTKDAVPVLIDFQWTGVGLGMMDVAMQLSHSISLSVLEERHTQERPRGSAHEDLVEGTGPVHDNFCNGRCHVREGGDGEEHLVDFYYKQITGLLSPEQLRRYPRCVALHDYHLCLVDYARVIFSRFWKGQTAAKFAANAGNANATMLTRSLPCVLRFVRRVEQCVSLLETRLAASQSD